LAGFDAGYELLCVKDQLRCYVQRGITMNGHEISKSSVRIDPINSNLTIPRSYGVWELPSGSSGKKYRYGNNPVRGVELANEFKSAKLLFLYKERLSAKDTADVLNK